MTVPHDRSNDRHDVRHRSPGRLTGAPGGFGVSRSAASGVAAGPRSRAREIRRPNAPRVLPPPLRRPNGSLFQASWSPRATVVDLGRARAARALQTVAAANMMTSKLSTGPIAVPVELVEALCAELRRIATEAVRNEVQPVLARLDALVAATDEVLTMEAAGKLLSVCSKTVLAWNRERELPGRKIGAEWRFLRSEIVRWIGGRDVR